MLALAGCASAPSAYRSALQRASPVTRARSLPSLPAPDEVARECPLGTHRVDQAGTSWDDKWLGFQRFCARPNGTPDGAFVYGEYSEQEARPVGTPPSLRALWGRLTGGRFDGLLTIVQGDSWSLESYRAGVPVGPFRGSHEGTPFEGAYDDQGRFHGRWALAAGAFTFDHGTGHIAWETRDMPDFAMLGSARVEGECVAGWVDGHWRSRFGDVAREIDYVHGDMQGHARLVAVATGRVIEEGDVDQGAWTSWRGTSGGGCLESHERHVGGCVVETVCDRAVPPFEVAVRCRSGECAYTRVTPSGAVPLTDEERKFVRLPAIVTGRRCPGPIEAGLFWGIFPVENAAWR